MEKDFRFGKVNLFIAILENGYAQHQIVQYCVLQ